MAHVPYICLQLLSTISHSPIGLIRHYHQISWAWPVTQYGRGQFVVYMIQEYGSHERVCEIDVSGNPVHSHAPHAPNLIGDDVVRGLIG